jgi:hypothetical protein
MHRILAVQGSSATQNANAEEDKNPAITAAETPQTSTGPIFTRRKSALLAFGDQKEQPGADLNAAWYLRNARIFAKLT